MDHNLIDQQILNLLRIPAVQRNQADIAEAVNRIAAAAQLDMTPLGPLQNEQIKLAAIVDFLAKEMNAKYYTVDLAMTDRNDPSRPLYARINIDLDNSLFGFGDTAEETLKNLRPETRRKTTA